MTSTQAEVVAVGLAAEVTLSEQGRVNIRNGDVQGWAVLSFKLLVLLN